MKENTKSFLLLQIAKFTGPTWGPAGSCRPQMGPILAPWTLLSGTPNKFRPIRVDFSWFTPVLARPVHNQRLLLAPAACELCVSSNQPLLAFTIAILAVIPIINGANLRSPAHIGWELRNYDYRVIRVTTNRVTFWGTYGRRRLTEWARPPESTWTTEVGRTQCGTARGRPQGNFRGDRTREGDKMIVGPVRIAAFIVLSVSGILLVAGLASPEWTAEGGGFWTVKHHIPRK